MIDSARAGWSGSFDKLAELLEEEKPGAPNTRLIAEPGKQEAVVVRIFDAPGERVFKAYTDPGDMARWWAPRRFSIIVDTMDVRPGGMWRILNRDAEGNEFWFHGVYHEVSSPSRLVYTFEFEGMPGHVLLGIIMFEDREGKTKVTEKSVFESVWDRDGMLESGMKEGVPEVMDRLAELVEKK
jgi:uncharacterized protein YndB with AHSA1/START domain